MLKFRFPRPIAESMLRQRGMTGGVNRDFLHRNIVR